MSFRGSGYPGYGQASMPMPAPPPSYRSQQQRFPSSYPTQNTPYPTQSNAYPTQSAAYLNATPAPSGTYPSSQPAPYPAPSRRSASPYMAQSFSNNSISATLDNAMEELLKNLTDLLSNATSEELEAIVNNEDKINSLIADSEQSKDLERKRKEMTNENQTMAFDNLSMKPELEVLKSKLTELADRQSTLKQSYSCNLQKVSSRVSPDTISAILEAATSEKETSSDKVKTSFFDEEIAVDEFLKKFIEERTIYQMRKIKLEKMNELLRGAGSSMPPNNLGYQAAQQRRSNVQPPPSGYFGYST